MKSCLLANTILRDMILTSLLWQNLQTKKLFGSPVLLLNTSLHERVVEISTQKLHEPFRDFFAKKMIVKKTGSSMVESFQKTISDHFFSGRNCIFIRF